ncbi:hypothetical protein ACSAZL_17055 [Methanosarcina sp. T3]
MNSIKKNIRNSLPIPKKKAYTGITAKETAGGDFEPGQKGYHPS